MMTPVAQNANILIAGFVFAFILFLGFATWITHHIQNNAGCFYILIIAVTTFVGVTLLIRSMFA